MNTREKAQELIRLLDAAKEGNGKDRQYVAAYAVAHGRQFARKLIEALDTIQAMCDSADRYEAHARAHPERDHALAWANGADSAVTAGRLFLARLDEKGGAEE